MHHLFSSWLEEQLDSILSNDKFGELIIFTAFDEIALLAPLIIGDGNFDVLLLTDGVSNILWYSAFVFSSLGRYLYNVQYV